MGLTIQYGEVRSNVINKLLDAQEEMVSVYKEMTDTVNSILSEKYMSGKAAEKYVLEFTDPIAEIFNDLNSNLHLYADELESICSEFEKSDQAIADVTHVVV